MAMLLASLGVQQVCAQKWAKKLGLAVAEEVVKDAKKTTTQSGKGTMLPGFTVKYTGCTISGNDAVIKAVITNNTGKDEKLRLQDCKAFDSNNAQHKVYLNLGGKEYSSYGLITDAVPAGVPVKVTIRAENVSRDVAAINSCKLNVQMRVKGGDYDWIIPPQNILLSKNTNADNIVCLFYPLPERTNIYDSDGESYNLDIDASKLANTYWSKSRGWLPREGQANLVFCL